MKYKGIIFDLDGVICKTDEYHYRAWNIIAMKMNLAFNENINNRLRGVSRLNSVDIILSENNLNYSIEEKILLASRKNEVYIKLLEQLSPTDLEKDVLYTLHYLKKNHYKIAIASGSKNAKRVLNQLEITELFDVIIDGNDITNTKPNPEIFLAALNQLDEPAEKVLVVEDATVGIHASRNAGIDVVAFGENCETSLANYCVLNLSGIIDILN
ncbi:MAG: beta-phosphoglucomutase [Lutisporaceae bacterium]